MSGYSFFNPLVVIRAAAKIHGLPEPTEQEAKTIAWEYTGYPCFFAGPHSFREQVLAFMREWKQTGKWPRHPLS